MTGDPTVPEFDSRLRQDVRRRLFGSSSGTPATVDRFEIVDRIGTGGMGVVYLARDPRLGRKVALKLLRVASEGCEDASTGHARLLREARALATLSHPHVVVVHEVGETDEQQIYLVMEYVEGRTLGQWCVDEARDWRTIVEQFIAVGEGLAHAHAAGVVHRDVKPDNVLIGIDGRARIVDFGLAGVELSLPPTRDDGSESTVLTKLTVTGTVMGTPAYMAPEQHLGAIADARSDQFALCVAMWEALTGERPFEGNTLPTLRRRVLAGRLRPLSRDRAIPASIARALRKGLHIDPSARHPTMDDWLDSMRAGLAASARRRSAPRRRQIALRLGAMVALGGAAMWWSPRGSDPSSDPEIDPETGSARSEPSVPTWSRITTTQGYGVHTPTVSHDGQRVYYRDSSGWWSISSRGGIPSRTDLGPDTVASFAPFRPGQWFTAAQGTLRRHSDQGATFVASMKYDFDPALHVSPEGRQILDHRWDEGRWTLRRWELEPSASVEGASSIPVVYEDYRFTGVAWSPSGARFAALAITPTDDGAMVVFDAHGAPLHSWPIDGRHSLSSGITWLPSGSIATFESNGEDRFVVRCDHLGPSGLTTTTRSAPVDGRIGFSSIFGHDGDQTLLVDRPTSTDDVVLIDLRSTPTHGDVVTSDNEARDRWPDWEANERLMYFTTRFGSPAIVRTMAASGSSQFEELGDVDVRWMSADGAGGVVINIEGRGIQHWPAHGAPQTTVLDERSSRDIGRPRCQAGTRCLSLRGDRDEPPMHFVEWSLDSGHVQRLITCAEEWGCIDPRWSLTRDDKGVLLPTERQSTVIDVDLHTGAVRRRFPRAPTSSIFQSAIELDSGDVYFTGMVIGLPADGDVYLLRRLDDSGHYVTVWSSPSTWIIDARPSPDDRYLAARGLTFHAEVWRLDVGSTCQPSP